MTLPFIVAPPEAPVFLAQGHQITEDGAFAEVGFANGHSRLRRTWTTTQRIVTVSWWLEAAALRAVESWYQDDLQAGALPFAARVASQDGAGLVYWSARWVSFQVEMLNRGRGRLSGVLFLYGEPSATGPDLSELAAEASIALNGDAAPTIPVEMAAEALIALVANAADLTLAAEASIELTGTAEVFEILLAAEASIPLIGDATATIGTGACSPFTVLGDTGITVSSGGAVSALPDEGSTFDACRELV